MKLSIWRQFSSNHSGHFSVVGVFEDAETAQKAADELRAIVQSIANWHRDNPEKSEALNEMWRDGSVTPLSQAEESIAEKYGVRWLSRIDWYDDVLITVIHNHIVHMTTRYQMDVGAEPFAQIVERLGGLGFITGSDIGGEPFGDLWVTLTCYAPDEETAVAIEKEYAPEFIHEEDVTESLQRFTKRLIFGWEWYEGVWNITDLINEMKERGCTKFTYQFTGRTYTSSPTYPVEE